MQEDSIKQNNQCINNALEYQVSIMRKKDLKIYMDDKPVTLAEALVRCVQERTVYMPDYVLDENGILEQVRFDKISM